MDHMPRLQTIAAGDLGLAGIAAAERLAFAQQFRPRRAMDGAVHAAAAEQRAVGGIDDGIDLERGDVADHKLDMRVAGFDGEERGGGHSQCLASSCAGRKRGFALKSPAILMTLA